MPSPRTRRLAQLLLAALLVVVAVITLWPSPVDESGRSTLLAVLDRLHARGVPQWVDYSFVERGANVVMFVPFGVLLAILLPRGYRWLAVVLPASMSLLVEVVQHLALPRRYASGWDVVANTTGALVGAVLAVLWIVAMQRRGRWADPAVTPAVGVTPRS